MTVPTVPLPAILGYCSDCRRDVPVPPNGRCQCGELLIWRSDQPRPEVTTETYLRALKATREIPDQAIEVVAEPAEINRYREAAAVRAGRRPKNADGTIRWATEFDACVGCGRTDRPHTGRGLCKPCRSTVVNRRKRAERAG